MTQSNDINVNYSAGVKLSVKMDAATIVLLQGSGADARVIGCETLNCSRSLREVWHWLDKQAAGANVTVVAGVDSSMLRFVDIRIPAVDPAQRCPLIQTQAEAMLPLSADQMALAWRIEQDSQGLLCRTAAARRDSLQPVLTQAKPVRVVTLDAVGLAAVWKRFGRTAGQSCILMYRRTHDFLTAFVQNGRLLRSAVIDAEGSDLEDGVPTGLLLQDVQIELEAMAADRKQKVPLFILSDNKQSDFLDTLCTHIREMGWETEIVFPEEASKQGCGAEALEAFGLALTAAGREPVDFDFCHAEKLQKPDEIPADKGIQLRKAVVITIALLALALGVTYWGTKKDVKLLRQIIASSHEDLTVQQVLNEQAYRKTVARARPDMTDLIERIRKCQGAILLDTFEFEKGKPVKITATTGSYNSAYKFQKELEEKNKTVITKVRLLDPRLDQQGKKVKFSMTFHYRNFSK